MYCIVLIWIMIYKKKTLFCIRVPASMWLFLRCHPLSTDIALNFPRLYFFFSTRIDATYPRVETLLDCTFSVVSAPKNMVIQSPIPYLHTRRSVPWTPPLLQPEKNFVSCPTPFLVFPCRFPYHPYLICYLFPFSNMSVVLWFTPDQTV